MNHGPKNIEADMDDVIARLTESGDDVVLRIRGLFRLREYTRDDMSETNANWITNSPVWREGKVDVLMPFKSHDGVMFHAEKGNEV